MTEGDSDDPDDVWDGESIMPSESSVRSTLKKEYKTIGDVFRVPFGFMLIAAGILGIGLSLGHLQEIQHFQLIKPVEIHETVVYRDPPTPPEPGFDTGNVTVTSVWYRVDKGKLTNSQTGQYQLETPDGVISLINICPSADVYPDFNKGDRVNIHLISDGKIDPHDSTRCYAFVRAKRWK